MVKINAYIGLKIHSKKKCRYRPKLKEYGPNKNIFLNRKNKCRFEQ